jgi:hypothetical protein
MGWSHSHTIWQITHVHVAWDCAKTMKVKQDHLEFTGLRRLFTLHRVALVGTSSRWLMPLGSEWLWLWYELRDLGSGGAECPEAVDTDGDEAACRACVRLRGSLLGRCARSGRAYGLDTWIPAKEGESRTGEVCGLVASGGMRVGYTGYCARGCARCAE